MKSIWKTVEHRIGPDSHKLEVAGVVMASVVYSIGSRGETKPPYQWQTHWGFKSESGGAASVDEAKRLAEENIQRHYEKFSQEWKDAFSKKAARHKS